MIGTRRKLLNGTYIVQSIEGKRIRRNEIEYLVNWEGYSEKTWEPVSNLISVRNMIAQFEDSLNDNKKKHGQPKSLKFLNQFNISKVVDIRGSYGNIEYFIKWKGFSNDSNTWEPEQFVKIRAQKEIDKFKVQYRKIKKLKKQIKEKQNSDVSIKIQLFNNKKFNAPNQDNDEVVSNKENDEQLNLNLLDKKDNDEQFNFKLLDNNEFDVSKKDNDEQFNFKLLDNNEFDISSQDNFENEELNAKLLGNNKFYPPNKDNNAQLNVKLLGNNKFYPPNKDNNSQLNVKLFDNNEFAAPNKDNDVQLNAKLLGNNEFPAPNLNIDEGKLFDIGQFQHGDQPQQILYAKPYLSQQLSQPLIHYQEGYLFKVDWKERANSKKPLPSYVSDNVFLENDCNCLAKYLLASIKYKGKNAEPVALIEEEKEQ